MHSYNYRETVYNNGMNQTVDEQAGLRRKTKSFLKPEMHFFHSWRFQLTGATDDICEPICFM